MNERISDCGANVVRPRWSGVVEMEGTDLAKWISGVRLLPHRRFFPCPAA
jgi:hypothetical protein